MFDEFIQSEITKATDSAIERRLAEIYAVFASDTEEAKTRRKQIAIINTKDLITISEAAILIGCSETTLRKKVEETRKFFQSQTRRALSLVEPRQEKPKSKAPEQPFDPIPFIDKSKVGIILFEREKLLEWIKSDYYQSEKKKEVA